MPEERFLSTEEVAERLQVDEQTVRRWIKSGKLEAVKPGREWRISPGAFEALLESYSSPKAQAPLPLDEATEAGPRSLMDMPQDEFLRVLSAAESDEALLGLYEAIDAERTNLELEYRKDETDLKARSAYHRGVERRMVVFLTLLERGIRRPDPEGESLARQAEQLENALLEGR